jgi:hypothetical protein
MAQNIIELGFNTEELSAEKKVVLDLLVDMFEQLKKYDGTKFNPLGAGGLSELKKSLQDGQKALADFLTKAKEYNTTLDDQFNKESKKKKGTDDLTAAEKIHAKTLEDTIQIQAKLSEANTNAANDKAIEAQKLRQVTTEVNANAKAYIAELGSMNELKATVAQLTIERNKQNINTAEGRQKITELNLEIDKNNELIRQNSATLEKQKINIGNYTGAANILREALDTIDGRLASMAAAGDKGSESFQKLTLEQNLLKNALIKQEAGFTGVTTEVRSLKTTLDTLTVAGLEHTEAFEKLNTVYTQSKQKLTELHNEQAILTAEEPGFVALTAAARGLGGAYAVGAGASALFANGNEKVEKELNKLVAIMTVLQGLEEAVKAIKDRGAIATALQAQAVKLLNFAEEINVKLFGKSIAVIEEETIVKEANLAVTEEQAVAGAAAAESSVVQSGAMEAVIGATEAATAATVTFSTVLTATVVGGVIIAAIYAIVQLAKAIYNFIEADELAIEKQKALAEATGKVLAVIKESDEFFIKSAEERIKALERQDDKEKAAGRNQFATLADEINIAGQKKAIYENLAKENGLSIEKVKENLEKEKGLNKQALDALEELQRKRRRIIDAGLGEKYADDKYKNLIEADEAVQKNHANAIEILTQIDEGYTNSVQEQETKQIELSKASAELIAKIQLDAAQRRYESVKATNDRILAADTSTSPQRLAAISANYAAEAALEHAHVADLRRQFNDGIIVEKDYNNQVATLATELNIKRKATDAERLREIVSARDREAAAKLKIKDNGNDIEIAQEEAITKDVQKELNQRLDALKISISDKTAKIADDYAEQLRLAREHGKTQTEIDAIESDQQKALVTLTAQTQKEIFDIYLSFGQRKQKFIDDQNKANSESTDVSAGYNQQVADLNASLVNQTVSYAKYVRTKRALDREYAREKAAADVQDDQEALKRQQDYEKNILESKRRIVEADLAAANASGDKTRIDNAQAAVNAIVQLQQEGATKEADIRKKLESDKQKLNDATVAENLKAAEFLHSKETELANASVNLAQQFVDAGFENRKNQIQAVIDKQNEQVQNELAGIQASSLSQQDKEAETVILQNQAKARETQLKKEQKDEEIKRPALIGTLPLRAHCGRVRRLKLQR